MNEPIQVPMPGVALPVLMKEGGKKEYNISELGELIDPVYRIYEEQIRRCISGLTAYAAQCAAAHHEEQRKIPLRMFMKFRNRNMDAPSMRP